MYIVTKEVLLRWMYNVNIKLEIWWHIYALIINWVRQRQMYHVVRIDKCL